MKSIGSVLPWLLFLLPLLLVFLAHFEGLNPWAVSVIAATVLGAQFCKDTIDRRETEAEAASREAVRRHALIRVSRGLDVYVQAIMSGIKPGIFCTIDGETDTELESEHHWMRANFDQDNYIFLAEQEKTQTRAWFLSELESPRCTEHLQYVRDVSLSEWSAGFRRGRALLEGSLMAYSGYFSEVELCLLELVINAQYPQLVEYALEIAEPSEPESPFEIAYSAHHSASGVEIFKVFVEGLARLHTQISEDVVMPPDLTQGQPMK